MSHTHRISIASDREALKQQKLTDVFISRSKSLSPVSSHRHDERFLLARRLSLWYSRDLLSFSLVDNIGFNDFWNSLHINIPLPSRSTIAIGALDDMYECIKNELKSMISTNGGIINEKSFHYFQFKVENSPCIFFTLQIYIFYQCTVQ